MKRLIVGLSYLLCGSSFLACTPPSMVVPTDIATHTDEILVTERSSMRGHFVNENFKMGPYAVTEVDREANTGSSVGIGGFSNESSSIGYAYTFAVPGGEMKAACQSSVSDMNVDHALVSYSKSSGKLGCACMSDAGKVELLMSAGKDKRLSGEVTTTQGKFRVTTIQERVGGMFGDTSAAGYRMDADNPAAVVDVLGNGRVWFGKALEDSQRAELACISAGLLLYMPPTQK